MRIRPNTSLNVAILGYGQLGRAMAQQLQQQHKGRLVLHTICERDANPLSIPKGICLTKHYQEVVTNPAIDVVVEAFGGTNTAFDAVHTALMHGKHVMTANTALMAAYGKSLLETARVQNVHLGCEAALMGGLGVARWAQTQQQPDSISLTCDDVANQVFLRMESTAESVDQASQRMGEQTAAAMTLAGRELLFKAALLQAFTWGQWTDVRMLHPQGVDQVTPETVRMAIRMGYRVRLLAQVTASAMHVGVQLVPENSALAQLNGQQLSLTGSQGTFHLQANQPLLTAATSGIQQDLMALMHHQPALRIPLAVRQAAAEQVNRQFMVTVPPALADKLRTDGRLSLMVEKQDTRTERLGAVVQTPMPAAEIRQSVGPDAFMLPLMSANQDKSEGLRV